MLNMISTLLSLATEGKRMLFSGKWDLLLVLGSVYCQPQATAETDEETGRRGRKTWVLLHPCSVLFPKRMALGKPITHGGEEEMWITNNISGKKKKKNLVSRAGLRLNYLAHQFIDA